jgi:hypothetical protein
MAGLFTHVWIANLVMQKLKRKQFISQFENIDDYFFGAIAPDIRYVANSPRQQTHKPFGKDTLIDALKASTPSMPFVAGYDVHLITDMTWSNDKNWLDQSIYEKYGIDSNNPLQKFALYGLVDDYFQAEADWFFPIQCAGNIIRANDTKIFTQLGFQEKDIFAFKSLSSIYLREPGIDTIISLSFVPNNLDEILVRKVLGEKSLLTSHLRSFEKVSLEKCLAHLERYL